MDVFGMAAEARLLLGARFVAAGLLPTKFTVRDKTTHSLTWSARSLFRLSLVRHSVGV